MESDQRFIISATLLHVSPHAFWYVQEGTTPFSNTIGEAAREFEEKTYPTVTRYFGAPWSDQEHQRLTILQANIPGVGGYYSGTDNYPPTINPYSNQRPMLYINATLRPGSREYQAVLAHEFQHAIHWYADPDEETWVNEGLSELAADLVGYPSGFVSAFLASPGIQLTQWPQDTEKSAANYGAAYLFMKYLAQHYGGYDTLKRLVAITETGTEGINVFFQGQGFSEDFDQVFARWVVANLVDGLGIEPYTYPDDRVQAKVNDEITSFGQVSGSVNQYAARYYELALPTGDVAIIFTGTATVNLIPTRPFSGRYIWWSNRGDSIDATLTREVDLRGLSRATLRYRLWYDTEKGWDYAYVLVSQDGGERWNILSGQGATTYDPVGNSFGPGYTGRSTTEGSGWVEDTVDLTPVAGKKVLLRFEYITDEAVNGPGVALDDISIPELSFFDDVEAGDGAWRAEGFVRTDNVLPQGFRVQLVVLTPGVEVREVALDAENRGRMEIKGLGTAGKRAVLIVSPLAPLTTQPASYQFAVTPLGSR